VHEKLYGASGLVQVCTPLILVMYCVECPNVWLGSWDLACLLLTLSFVVQCCCFYLLLCAVQFCLYFGVPFPYRINVCQTRRAASETRENDKDASTLIVGNNQRVHNFRSVLPADLCTLPRISTNQMRVTSTRAELRARDGRLWWVYKESQIATLPFLG